MNARAAITLTCVAAGWGLQAQYPKPFAGPLPWSASAPVVWDPLWEAAAASVTTVLSDTLSVRFRGNKPLNLHVFFERRRVVRYASDDDVARHAVTVLPESLDPPYDRRDRAWGEHHGFEGPDWCDVRVETFAARRLHRDGTWQELPYIRKQRTDTVRSLRAQDVIVRYRYELQDVQVGDVVEYHWKYVVPYDLNWPYSVGWNQHELAGNWQRLTSWRIFFHGELPVLQQFVEVLHHSRQGLLVAGEKPVAVEEDLNDMRRVWVFYDLPGAMAEVNARPASHLPHIMLQLNLFDPRFFTRDRLSYQPLPTPYWANVLRWREQKADWFRRVAQKRIPDRQNRLVNEFIARHDGGLPADDRTGRAMRLHQQLADHFRVERDDAWFAGQDQSLDRFGDQLDEGVIRERSRYDLYSKLLSGVDQYYRTAYLLDRRIGDLLPAYLTPLWEAPFAFVLGETGEETILVPPDRFLSLQANELPFYWSGSRALICEIDALWRLVAPLPIFMDMPEQAQADLRRMELRVKVDPLLGTATATARLFHSGQFSTLCRDAYLRGRLDPRVHPAYGHRLYDAPQVRLLHQEAGPPQPDAPFRQVTTLTLDLTPALLRTVDAQWTLDLSGVLQHVVPDDFAAATRTQPFHWDFAQDDRITVIVDAPAGIEVLPMGVEEGEWQCASALYRFRRERHPDGSWRMTSQLIVHDNVEPVSGRHLLGGLLWHAGTLGGLRLLIVEEPPSTDGR